MTSDANEPVPSMEYYGNGASSTSDASGPGGGNPRRVRDLLSRAVARSRSALFFGQLVWFTVMQRPERWASGRYQLDDKDIGSRTYFRLTR